MKNLLVINFTLNISNNLTFVYKIYVVVFDG